MLTIGLVDANARANKKYAGIVSSVVGKWLTYELSQKGIVLVEPKTADIVLLAFAGAMDYIASAKTYLRREGIEPLSNKRKRAPYVIAGGPVDSSPFEAITIADAVAIGEGYTFIRGLADMVAGNAALADIRRWIMEFPHALEREQIESLARDAERPWLLKDKPPVLATPDTYIDWMGTPPIQADDKVVRVLGSKGCHLKCAFCATSYRQEYQMNPNGLAVERTVRALVAGGERVQILSNDPANLKFWPNIRSKMASQSFTIMEMRDKALRDALKESGVGIARFGVEGVSERIRQSFGKKISNDELLDITGELHQSKLNTRWFMIMGAPFENDEDWDNFRGLHYRLARLLNHGVCQIKFTAFVPNPPAPLVRYLPSFRYNDNLKKHVAWLRDHAVSRHVMCYYGNQRPSQEKSIAEQLAISPVLVGRLADMAEDTGRPFDFFPSVDDAERAPWEMIGWPISAAQRWKIAGIYARRMSTIGREA